MKDNSGLTLVELVVAIAILGAILLSIYSFYIVGVKGFTRETTTAANQTDIRRASNEIARQVRRASEVDTANVATSYNAELKLTFPEDSDVISIIYKLEGNRLMAMNFVSDLPTGQGPDYSNVIADRIQSFDVSPDKNPDEQDQIHITITSINNADDQSEELTTVLTLRK